MHKKLVKYGNSNALILDRAILELLNIKEGSVVKLKTDGKSLIITPEEPAKVADMHMTGMEMLQNLGQANTAAAKADPEIAKWMPGGENFPKYMEMYMPIHLRYMDDMAKFQSEEYLQELDDLAVKYHGDSSSAEFLKEVRELRDKHAPNLVNFDKEMREMYKQLGMPDSFDWGSPRS